VRILTVTFLSMFFAKVQKCRIFCIVRNSCRDFRNGFHSWESWWRYRRV